MGRLEKFFFFHIPKTAGQSFNELLAQLYGSKALIHCEATSEWGSAPDMRRLSAWSSYDCISGHVRRDEVERYMDLSQFRTGFFIRDAQAQLLSHFRWLAALDRHSLAIRYDAFDEQNTEIFNIGQMICNDPTRLLAYESRLFLSLFDNCITRYITLVEGDREVTPYDVEAAIAKLDTYDFVGVTEDFVGSMARFAETVGTDIPTRDIRANEARVELPGVAEILKMGRMRQFCQYDAALYAHVQRRLKDAAGRFPARAGPVETMAPQPIGLEQAVAWEWAPDSGSVYLDNQELHVLVFRGGFRARFSAGQLPSAPDGGKGVLCLDVSWKEAGEEGACFDLNILRDGVACPEQPPNCQKVWHIPRNVCKRAQLAFDLPPDLRPTDELNLRMFDGGILSPFLATIHSITYRLVPATSDEAIRISHASRICKMVKNNISLSFLYYVGWTPLHFAANWNMLDYAAMIIRGGGDIDKAEQNGATALHRAADHGYMEMLALLLEAGADVNAINTQEKATAMDVAVRKGHKDAAALLLQYGGLTLSEVLSARAALMG